jgi:hypothetical protein
MEQLAMRVGCVAIRFKMLTNSQSELKLKVIQAARFAKGFAWRTGSDLSFGMLSILSIKWSVASPKL